MISFMGVMLDGCLCVMLACFCPFHIRMAMLNETTIEGPSPAFDVGMRKNWQQVRAHARRTPMQAQTPFDDFERVVSCSSS